MRTPQEVAAELRRHIQNNEGLVSYDRIEELLTNALKARDREHRAMNLCDCCAGTGKLMSQMPCACGGTGRKSDAVNYFRRQVQKLQQELEALKQLPGVPASP